MNEEIKKTLDEMRSAFDEKMQKLDEKQKNLEAREFEIAQKEARANAPVEVADKAVEIRDVVSAMAEKRAITLGGTGGTRLVRELFQKIEESNDIVSEASFYVGTNAATKIPVLNPGPARPSKVTEGVTGVAADTTAVLSACEIDPYTWFAELPVTWENAKFSGADIEKRLPSIMAKSFRQSMGTAMITGTGSGNSMKGIFASVPTANKITCKAAGAPTRDDLKAFAVKLKAMQFDKPVMVMSDEIFSEITAVEPTGYDPVYNSLCETNPNVLGVPVKVTAKAPSAKTSGSLMVWGGELSNYGIGMATDVEIRPVVTPGSTLTYFQAIGSFSGKVIVEDNTYGLVAHA